MNTFEPIPNNNDGAYIYAYMGIVCSLVFANIGAAFGTAKSGIAICTSDILNPQALVKSFVPIIISGVLGIYGLIVSVILSSQVKGIIDLPKGYAMFASGLVCGLSSLAAGIAIGFVGDAGVRAIGQQGKLYWGFIMLLVFAEALGLYGLIVALLIAN